MVFRPYCQACNVWNRYSSCRLFLLMICILFITILIKYVEIKQNQWRAETNDVQLLTQHNFLSIKKGIGNDVISFQPFNFKKENMSNVVQEWRKYGKSLKWKAMDVLKLVRYIHKALIGLVSTTIL